MGLWDSIQSLSELGRTRVRIRDVENQHLTSKPAIRQVMINGCSTKSIKSKQTPKLGAGYPLIVPMVCVACILYRLYGYDM